jgi:hypothetical protein
MERRTDIDRQLRDMLDDVPPHDDSARRATLEALPATPQRRFRWLPPFIGGPSGRGLSFAGLTAGLTVVVAVGALGLGFGDRSGERGAGSPDLSPPDSFHGTILCGPDVTGSRIAYTDLNQEGTELRLAESRGGAHRLSIEEMTDPRLEGEPINQLDTDVYGLGADAPEFGALTWTLRNDDGAWTTQFVSFETDSIDWSTASVSWTGSGGYEGLTALTQLDYRPATPGSDCSWMVTGIVVDSALLPEFPEPLPDLTGG